MAAPKQFHTHSSCKWALFLADFLAAYMVVHLLPPEIGFTDALKVAGKMNKLNAIDTKFDLNKQYLVGPDWRLFPRLSYFGTDQSQVGDILMVAPVKAKQTGAGNERT